MSLRLDARGNSGSRVGTTEQPLVLQTIRRRIKKMLPKV